MAFIKKIEKRARLLVISFILSLALFSVVSAQTGDDIIKQLQIPQSPQGPVNPNFNPNSPYDPFTNPFGVQNTPNTNPAPQDTGDDGDSVYTLLAPFSDQLTSFNTKQSCALAKYMNIMITIAIGIAAVLSMVMIVLGGLRWMTSELISSKEEGKSNIKNAVMGLLLIFAAWLILNTLNPQLLNLCAAIPEVKITISEESGDDTIDPDYANGVKVYSQNMPVTPSVATAAQKLADNWVITKINVYSSTNTMQIDMMKNGQLDNGTYLSMRPGANGYAAPGTAQAGDKKTPIGSWSIIGIKYTAGTAQFNKKGSNMGAAFWHLSPMSSGERGIGIHGNKSGTLTSTNGCIRLKNSDILALQPYIKTGIPVIVH